MDMFEMRCTTSLGLAARAIVERLETEKAGDRSRRQSREETPKMGNLRRQYATAGARTAPRAETERPATEAAGKSPVDGTGTATRGRGGTREALIPALPPHGSAGGSTASPPAHSRPSKMACSTS